MNNNFDAIHMLNITKRLSNLMEEEIALLKDMKVLQLNRLTQEKTALTNMLDNYTLMLNKNPELINDVPQDILEKIKAESDKFFQIVDDNKIQILKAKKVYQMVVEVIKKCVDKKLSGDSTYNEDGVISGNNSTYITTPISVNEEI